MTTLTAGDGNAARPASEWKPGSELPLGSWIFSTDDHLLEGSYTFAGRVPKRFADAAPRIVDHDGGDAWLIEGKPVQIAWNDGPASVEIGGRPKLRFRAGPATANMDELTAKGAGQAARPSEAPVNALEGRMARGLVRVEEDFDPAVYNVHARVAAMDRDGVCASVLIPSMTWGFAGQRFSLIEDAEAGLAFVRAYNDWLSEEVAGLYPDRFVPSAIPWLRDPEIAAGEIRRNAARGFKATLFPESPERFGFPSIHTRHWDPVWAACEETETVLNVHLGTGFIPTPASSDSPLAVLKASFAANSTLSAFDWVFSGIAVRYPDIKVSFTEGGIDFVPLVYGRLDTLWEDSLDGSWDADLLPTEVFVRNFWFSALFDVGAYQFIAEHCPGHGMIETDFPHGDSLWPHSQEHFRARLACFAPEERDRWALTNASALYRHPLPDALRG